MKGKERKERRQHKSPFSAQLVLSAEVLADSHLTVHSRRHFLSVYRLSPKGHQWQVLDCSLWGYSGWFVKTRWEHAKQYLSTVLEGRFLNDGIRKGGGLGYTNNFFISLSIEVKIICMITLTTVVSLVHYLLYNTEKGLNIETELLSWK